MTQPLPSDLEILRRNEICESIEALCACVGLSDSLAHLYAVVFCSPTQPVRLTDAANEAGVAKSTASVGLRKLVALGLVLKQQSTEDRQDAYRPNPEAIQCVTRRLAAWLSPTIGHLARLQHSLGQQAGDTQVSPAAALEARDRLGEVDALAELLSSVLGSVAQPAGAATSPRPRRAPSMHTMLAEHPRTIGAGGLA